MQSTWKIVKNKGLARGIEHYTIRGWGLTKASIFHSFLSSLVTNYKTFTFYSGRERKELKRKKEEEEEEEGKCQVANGDKDSERERHLCETKCFCNCMGD